MGEYDDVTFFLFDLMFKGPELFHRHYNIHFKLIFVHNEVP